MAESVVYQEQTETQRVLVQVETSAASLWSQLDLARQKQMAQWLAELIQRIRQNPCQKRSSDEGE